jgi:putative DNA primase/helicase
VYRDDEGNVHSQLTLGHPANVFDTWDKQSRIVLKLWAKGRSINEIAKKVDLLPVQVEECIEAWQEAHGNPRNGMKTEAERTVPEMPLPVKPEIVSQVDDAPVWTPLTAAELIAKYIAPRASILTERGSTLFYAGSVNQILAWRGVGKTMWAMALADAIAGGGQILGFKADRPRRVLYVDGELPLAQLQERARDLISPASLPNVRFFNPEMLDNPRGLNLLETGDFAALCRMVQHYSIEVVFLDSQSTLCPGDSNKSEFQEPHLRMMRHLRTLGLCVIEMHHEGKAGLQRGNSKNDDILDVQMQLKRVEDWESGDGLRFEMTFLKVRHAARLESGYHVTREDGLWVRRAANEVEQAAELFGMGRTVRQVATEMGCSTGKASKLRSQAYRQGLLRMPEGVRITM